MTGSYLRNRLFCPGPTPVPHAAALSSLNTNIYHRSQEFKDILISTRQELQAFFKGPHDPLILTSSGTGAMEAAMVNLTEPGDEILVIEGGKFGERWRKLGEAYACQTHVIDIPWGASPDMEQLEAKLLSLKNLKAFFIQANETSTGVAYPLLDILPLVRQNTDALIVVDAISALVAHELPMDKLPIDCLLSGSQKGFGVPPGLAFLALSQRAQERLSKRPKFYFDLKKELEGQDKGLTAWTPATTLILSLQESLRALNQIGPNKLAEQHRRAALACHAAAAAMGLSLFSREHHSHALTAIRLPASIDGGQFLSHARDHYGAIFAGGQDQVKGKIVRIAHLGFFDEQDIISAISSFELTLAAMEYDFTVGSGVGAALKALATDTI